VQRPARRNQKKNRDANHCQPQTAASPHFFTVSAQ
jgi:hypothetical protein